MLYESATNFTKENLKITVGEQMETKKIPDSIQETIQQVEEWHPEVSAYFQQCFSNTYKTTLEPQYDQSTFIITGDIPAMWLRDSTAQIRPYLVLAENDPEMLNLIAGVIKRQVEYILHDPYANAFNREPNGKGHQNDNTRMTPWIWERKYELDSLCYPIQLAYLFWKLTGRTDHFTPSFLKAVDAIVDLWITEQNHTNLSNYRFERGTGILSDTLPDNGHGTPVSKTGMTWSGFRPSDDACEYGYLIPSNAFATVVLGYLTEMEAIQQNKELLNKIHKLKSQIETGLQQFGQVEHPEFGTIYAYETDGYNNFNLMDDANIPSLLSLPYLGFCDVDDPIYLNTRRFILSKENPYYFEGLYANGVGSPHTPKDHVWPLSLIMQGLTSRSRSEREEVLDTLLRTDDNTRFMHESFNADSPTNYTRPWFSWANALFSEFVMDLCGIRIQK